MTFKDLSIYLEKLDGTTSRNTLTEILAELFKKASASEIDKIIYLLQGKIAPLYEHKEFQMADKMVIKAIAQAFDTEEKHVLEAFKKIGDIGLAAKKFADEAHHKAKDLSVADVFSVLLQIAETSGDGSVEKKVTLMANLLKDLDSVSVIYVSRIPVGRLRLGFSDMTVLDSLSWMLSGSKEHRARLETAFNVRPDLGTLAKMVKDKGMKEIEHIKPAVFTPILMARAERLSSGKEIIEKLGNCAVEPKFDGFRLQAHFDGKEVKLYTRSLDDATYMYPDVVEGIKSQLNCRSAILEGEAIAYNPDTGEFLPFQETTQRRRKHGIEEKATSSPLKLQCFELLYLNGVSLIADPYTKRRKDLAGIIKKGNTVMLAKQTVTDDPKVVENVFDEYITEGLEGIVVKNLTGTYQAGARGFNWIKLKRSYSASALNDTIDCIVMGYYVGQGKRTDFGIGAFLIGIYDKKQDKFVTISKVGTGLTDNEWRELYKRSQKLKSKTKPPLYEVDKGLEPDVWIEPNIVVEIRADELTRSPNHTAGRVMKPSKSGTAFDVDILGYALRFPRLEKFRDDKKPEDATELKEIEEMFKKQGKK